MNIAEIAGLGFDSMDQRFAGDTRDIDGPGSHDSAATGISGGIWQSVASSGGAIDCESQTFCLAIFSLAIYARVLLDPDCSSLIVSMLLTVDHDLHGAGGIDGGWAAATHVQQPVSWDMSTPCVGVDGRQHIGSSPDGSGGGRQSYGTGERPVRDSIPA